MKLCSPESLKRFLTNNFYNHDFDFYLVGIDFLMLIERYNLFSKISEKNW